MGAQSSSLFEPWSTGSAGLKLVTVQRSVPNVEPRRLLDAGVVKVFRAQWDGAAWTHEPRHSMAVVTLYETAARPILRVREEADERCTAIELERGGAVALSEPRSVLLSMQSQDDGTGRLAALLAIFEHESDARTVLAHAAKTPKRSASRGGERRAAKLPREM